MKLGVHVSTKKPFSDSVIRANEVGCDCMQIFVNPPQRWNPSLISDEEIQKYLDLNIKHKISPVIIHSIYLLNLASSNPFFYESSIKTLVDEMEKAKKIGALGVNFHVGSTKGAEISEVMSKVVSAIRRILELSPEGPFLIIENSAGAGNIIGDTLEEIAQIITDVKSDRLRVLIDTAHAFESGYDLRNKNGLDNFIDKFDNLIGLNKLVGFHLNDSKTEFNSKRDRHADIGRGYLGLSSFKEIITNKRLSDKFGILETPEDELSWVEQIKILREMEKK